MKAITTVFLTAAVALSLIGCGAPATNTGNAAANTNTAKPSAAAPTTDTLMALEKQANEAYTKGDSKFFETFLSNKFVMMGMDGKHHDKASAIKEIGGVKCDVKSMDLTEPQMAKVDNDTYILSYKAAWDGTCTEKGKSMKIPTPMRAASVFVREGEKWVGAWHGETMIHEAKKADADDAKAAPKKDDAKADVKKEEPKKEEPKKEDAVAKKDDAKKDDAKKEDGTASTDSAKPAEVKPSANTDALTKAHQAGWEAWAAKDGAKLASSTASNLSFVSPTGQWFGTKDEVLKAWAAMDCKDVKNVKVSDGFGWALSPTVELFLHKGTADGTCDGMKNGPLYGSAVYVKEGNDWKMAFLFESPAA